MDKTLGGEFELSPELISNSQNYIFGGYLYNSGRSALFFIIRNIKLHHPYVRKILIPDYVCGSVVDVLKMHNLQIEYYNLNQELTLDINSFSRIYKKNDIVLITNYFGITDTTNQIIQIREIDNDAKIILDNVQALFEMHKPSLADYSFTSFRKWLPTPDGALVVTQKEEMEQPLCDNSFAQYKFAGSLMKSLKTKMHIEDKLYLELFRHGEDLISSNIENRISSITSQIFANIDLFEISEIRKCNASFIVTELLNIGIDPVVNIDRDSVPLFIPVALKQRDYVRQKMMDNGIFCPYHWPTNNLSHLMGLKMSKTELSLIIDQRYSTNDLGKIIEILKECK